MNHISFSTKQAKAIKTLLLNQDSKNEVTLQILEGLKRVDNDMTLEEAHVIVDKMNQEKRDAVSDILTGNVLNYPNRDYKKKLNKLHNWYSIIATWILLHVLLTNV